MSRQLDEGFLRTQTRIDQRNFPIEDYAKQILNSTKNLHHALLLLMLITITLELTSANDFLENCPIEREHRVDNDLVINVLRTFYKDLNFVRACTESRQDRSYDVIVEEIKSAIKSRDLKKRLGRIVEFLRTDRPYKAAFSLMPSDSFSGFTSTPMYIRSFSHYLAAEAYRLLERVTDASDEIKEAINIRGESIGVSMNELEKIDGLIGIQRVSRFNQVVDYLYGLRRSPSFGLLQEIHSRSKDDIDPFRVNASQEFQKMFGSDRSITQSLKDREIGRLKTKRAGKSDDLIYERINPEQDDFSGHSVAQTSVEGILCEFARKLAILVKEARADYDGLISQLKKIDPIIAEDFNERVIKNIETGNWDGAEDYFSRFGENYEASVPSQHIKVLITYGMYFKAELFRLSINNCENLMDTERLLESIKRVRLTYQGVPLGKILEIEGKVVLLSMKCFHNRLRSAYKLNGDENDQEIADKRAQFGNCDNIIPDSSTDLSEES